MSSNPDYPQISTRSKDSGGKHVFVEMSNSRYRYSVAQNKKAVLEEVKSKQGGNMAENGIRVRVMFNELPKVEQAVRDVDGVDGLRTFKEDVNKKLKR